MKNRILTTSSVAALLVGAGSMMFAASAQAQSAAQAANDQGLETVTVTAQRVTQDEQKTPIAMAVLTSRDLTNLGGPLDAKSLQQAAPNIQVNDTGNGGAQFTVRGIASTNTTQWSDPAIAFNIDGVYLGRWNQGGSAFYDVERVELLLGPQGTLYGRNATAGAINIITNKPTGDFHIGGSVEAGSYGEVTLTGQLNIPITDNFWFRAAFQSSGHGSYFNDNPPNTLPNTVSNTIAANAQGQQAQTFPAMNCAGVNNITHSPCSTNNDFMDYGMANQQNARIHFKWMPNSSITNLFTVSYQSIRGTPPATGKVLDAHGKPVGSPYYIPYNDGTGFQDTWEYAAAWNTDWDTSIGTVHYTAAYDFQHDQYDGANSIAFNAPQYSWYWQIPQQITQELRLSNSIPDKLTYVIGLYWYQENISKDLATGYGARFVHNHLWDDSKATYGQVTYTVIPGLRATAGLRLTEDSKGTVGTGNFYTTLNNAAYNGLGLYGGGASNYNPNCNPTNYFGCLTKGTLAERTPNIARLKWKKLNYHFGLDYDLTDENLIYLSYGTGYKAGGILDGEESQVGHFNPENVVAAEIGTKNRFFDNTLQVNFDLFHYLYTEFQVSYSDLVNHIAWTINAQKAKPQGAEFHAIWAPNSEDMFDLSLAYLDAHYAKFILPNVDTYGRQNYSGTVMAGSPPWEVDFSYEHTFDLASGASFVARFNTHYQSGEQLDYRSLNSTKQVGYTNSGLSFTYHEPDNRWDVQLWVRNLENRAVLQAASPAPVGTVGATGTIGAPRTFGIRLEANY